MAMGAAEIKDLFVTASKNNGTFFDELEYLHVYILMSRMFITLMSISAVLPNSSIVFTLGRKPAGINIGLLSSISNVTECSKLIFPKF